MSEQVKIIDGKPVCFLYDEQLPSKVVVCSRCDGKGVSTAYLGAYTPEEMDEQGPEFFDDYMGGRFVTIFDHFGLNFVYGIAVVRNLPIHPFHVARGFSSSQCVVFVRLAVRHDIHGNLSCVGHLITSKVGVALVVVVLVLLFQIGAMLTQEKVTIWKHFV